MHEGISNTILYYIKIIAEIPIHANANMLPSLTLDPFLDYPSLWVPAHPFEKQMHVYTSNNVKWVDCNIDLLYVLTFSPVAEYNESYYVTDGALDESTEICYHDCDCENFTCYHTGELYIMTSYPIHKKVFIGTTVAIFAT